MYKRTFKLTNFIAHHNTESLTATLLSLEACLLFSCGVPRDKSTDSPAKHLPVTMAVQHVTNTRVFKLNSSLCFTHNKLRHSDKMWLEGTANMFLILRIWRQCKIQKQKHLNDAYQNSVHTLIHVWYFGGCLTLKHVFFFLTCMWPSSGQARLLAYILDFNRVTSQTFVRITWHSELGCEHTCTSHFSRHSPEVTLSKATIVRAT